MTRSRRGSNGRAAVNAAIAGLARALGVGADETSESIAEEFFSGSLIRANEYPDVVAALGQGSKVAERFASLHALAGSERVKAYQSIFCTAELEPRKNIVTRAIRENHPGLFQRLMAEQERVCALIARRRAIETRERTAALVTIAAEVIKRYRAEKTRRGLLDYDDLIDKTLHLLANVDAAWVHYKLDLGVDHVLIDEAQDTSAKQWEIVARLVSEFAAGHGAREGRALDLRGRRREAVDLLVPGRRTETVRGAARRIPAPLTRRAGWNSAAASSSIRSAPARTFSARSIPCSACARCSPA